MRYAALSAAVLAGLLTTAAVAQDASVPPTLPANTIYSTSAPAEVTNPPNGDDTQVCNYQRETGSLLITRVCRTLRAWKAMQAASREFMDFGFRGSHQCQSTSCNSAGGG